jgi:tRNA nucleotidyltransferase (CCA-adding enzyme)
VIAGRRDRFALPPYEDTSDRRADPADIRAFAYRFRMIEELRPIAEAISARGGRAIAVGGFVRDFLLGRPAKDLDVEVFGLTAADLEAALRGFGEVHAFGRSFPVMRVAGRQIDFSVAPRSDFAEAARRRDLTIDAIGLDPLSGEILDPLGGRADLAARVLRAADPRTFGSDPLRGLRVMQVAARFAMEPDPELVALCRALDLAGLPGERLLVEFDKLLLRADQPSRGLEVLRRTGLARFFPELADPEGREASHTERALDAAARLRTGSREAPSPDDRALMYAMLLHNSRAELARNFLERLRAPKALVAQVLALIEHARMPEALARAADPPAYRRLLRQLDAAGVSPQLLERAARAAAEARGRSFPEGGRFLAEVARLALLEGGPHDAVFGRHLLARGLAPGPEFARILARCREVQDETGWSDPEAILRRALDSSA